MTCQSPRYSACSLLSPRVQVANLVYKYRHVVQTCIYSCNPFFCVPVSIIYMHLLIREQTIHYVSKSKALASTGSTNDTISTQCHSSMRKTTNLSASFDSVVIRSGCVSDPQCSNSRSATFATGFTTTCLFYFLHIPCL